jgi:hypothetical protein
MPLQKLRENNWAFSFEVVTPTDHHIYTVSYKTLADADANMQQDHDAITALGQVASKIKVQHAAMAVADPTTYEYCTHLRAQTKEILVSLTTKVEHGTTQAESYCRTKTQVAGPEDLPAMHAEHKQRTADHVARLASNAERMTRLQSIG